MSLEELYKQFNISMLQLDSMKSLSNFRWFTSDIRHLVDKKQWKRVMGSHGAHVSRRGLYLYYSPVTSI